MYQKVQGIVLNTINYNDKYILTQIYTDTLGRVTYMVPKTSGKSSKVKRNLFTPLSVLDLEVEHRDSRDIQRIREAHIALPVYSISCDMGKSTIVFFLSEFLNRILRDVNDNQALFEFLYQSVQILEYTEKSTANYHLVFMVRLSRFLGFYPNLEDYSPGYIFDMLNGTFVSRQPMHRHFVSQTESISLAKLGRMTYDNMHLFRFSQKDRTNIINRILEYYRIHIGDFPPIKSLDILHELFK